MGVLGASQASRIVHAPRSRVDADRPALQAYGGFCGWGRTLGADRLAISARRPLAAHTPINNVHIAGHDFDAHKYAMSIVIADMRGLPTTADRASSSSRCGRAQSRAGRRTREPTGRTGETPREIVRRSCEPAGSLASTRELARCGARGKRSAEGPPRPRRGPRLHPRPIRAATTAATTAALAAIDARGPAGVREAGDSPDGRGVRPVPLKVWSRLFWGHPPAGGLSDAQ